jgi:hypothetical protein
MYGFQIRQLVVVGVDTDAEEEPGIASIDDLCGGEVLAYERGGGGGGVRGRGAELDEVGLVFLVAWGDQAMDLDTLVGLWIVGSFGGWWSCEVRVKMQGPRTSPFNLTFSSSV